MALLDYVHEMSVVYSMMQVAQLAKARANHA